MPTAAINGHAEGPTIPASAETLVRFQFGRQPDAPEDPAAPVYLLAGHGAKALSAYQAGCRARGVRNPSDDELVRAYAAALDRAKPASDETQTSHAWFCAIVQRYAALPPYDAATDGPESFDRMAVLGGVAALQEVVKDDPLVKPLLDKRANYGTDSLKVACAVALVGTERCEWTVERVGLEATAATLAQLADQEQQAIGLYWLLQSNLSAAQKKSSSSSLPSVETPTTIPATSAVPIAGSNGGRTRSTTRGTRSTRTIPAG